MVYTLIIDFQHLWYIYLVIPAVYPITNEFLNLVSSWFLFRSFARFTINKVWSEVFYMSLMLVTCQSIMEQNS